MERHSHDTVRQVEGLLHTISVMDVNINIQNTRVVSTNRRKSSIIVCSAPNHAPTHKA